ncbi:MAG: transposase [candidate division Zixibacteria bacterium]|nr:transposase [candidate division Zixibacteria bacterium]
MSKLRRYFSGNQVSFLTNVTLDRYPLLVKHIDLFEQATQASRERSPFDLIAWVVLPEHFHCVIESVTDNPSQIMRRLKLSFSQRLRNRMKVRSGRVWQYRFWDHVIRSQDDLNQHIDYIHYNPVKHGLVDAPIRWPYSSFGEYVRNGFYRSDWGMKEQIVIDGDFGE